MSLQTTPDMTPTLIMRESSQSDKKIEREWPLRDPAMWSSWTLDVPVSQSPPEKALLNVVMTFGGGTVRMEAIDIGLSVEGRTAPEVYGDLVEAVRTYLETSGDGNSELLRYTPETWFRFVAPNQKRYEVPEADFWPEGESVEDFIEAATEGRYEEDEPES